MKEMKNQNGFTLVELLAVIVILGLLMAIAIPSVTKYITQSRKKTLVSSVDSYVTAVTTAVNDNEFGAMSKEDTMYYVPVSNNENNSCVSLEKGGSDPFGNWMQAYVVVNYDADKYSYDYYFTFFDDAGYGMELTEISKIDASSNLIINPSPVDASNITTQKNNRASNIKVLTTNSCEVSTAVDGGPNISGNINGGNVVNSYKLSGTWEFNEELTDPNFDGITEVYFESMGMEFKSIDFDHPWGFTMRYYETNGTGWDVYGIGWHGGTAAKILEFKQEQIVSQEFYNWFTANAIKN